MTTTVHIKNDEKSHHDIRIKNWGIVIKPGETKTHYCYDGGDLVIEEVPLIIPHST